MTKILIVDDSDSLRLQISGVLSAAGFEVLEAGTGAAGVLMWEKHGETISLIVTDYNMPEMDGISMVRKIRTTPKGLQVPVFLLTTESSAELKNLGREVGVKAWVTKPCPPEKLVAAIKKTLSI